MEDAPVRVSLVGPIGLEGPTGVLDERALGGRQGRVVFAVLVSARHRPVPKEELAEALWPKELPASWQAALRGVVTKVRSALTGAGLDGANAIRSAFGCYQLALAPDAIVDLDAAAGAVEAAEAALSQGNARRARALAESAAAITSQPFLAGEEGPFPDRIRRQLAALHLRGLEVLGRADLAVEDVGAAVGAAEAALGVEPFRESAHRLLMSAYAAAGSRGEALRAYERCRLLLAEELGVRPSAETEEAYRALLGDEPPGAAPPLAPAAPAAVPVPGAPPLPALPDGPFVGREPECWRRITWAVSSPRLVPALAEGIPGDVGLEEGQGRVGPVPGQFGLSQRLDGEQAGLLQASRLHPGQLQVSQIVQGGATPQGKGAGEGAGGPFGRPGREQLPTPPKE